MSRLQKAEQELVDLFHQVYEMTEPECAKCRRPWSCCNKLACDMAANMAKEFWGVTLTPINPKIPFLGPNGCIVAPHLRPLCTLHTCDLSAWGFKPDDKTWTERYFALRDRIDKLEWERNAIREA